MSHNISIFINVTFSLTNTIIYTTYLVFIIILLTSLYIQLHYKVLINITTLITLYLFNINKFTLIVRQIMNNF